jgi:spermidine synthase
MTDQSSKSPLLKSHYVMLLVVCITAICGIVYELMISTAASYLMGDSVKQFSIIIGIYMSSMGLGAYLSKFFNDKLIERFLQVEIIVSLIGGSSIILIFYFYAMGGILYSIVLYGLTILIGMLVGFEIPLVIRIMENILKLKENVANVLAFDYVGGLVGSVAFPLLLLPSLGIMKTAMLMGALNLISALWLILKLKNFKHKKAYLAFVIVFISLLGAGMLYAEPINYYLEQNLYKDKVIITEQTRYQKLVVTRYKNDIRLFIDGNLQFSSTDEYRYHEGIVHIPASLTPDLKDVLILGGGDGLAAREVLKHNSVENIILVDLDKKMIDLFKNNKILSELNNKSLQNPRVQAITTDAFDYVNNDNNYYDLIIVDLPDPRTPSLSKLYCKQFYQLAKKRLKPAGILVTQATSPFFSRRTFWCIVKTMEEVFPHVNEYHIDIMSFGDWGFVMGSKIPVDHKTLKTRKIEVSTRFIHNRLALTFFEFGKDISRPDDIKINTLLSPVIVQYYLQDWNKW